MKAIAIVPGLNLLYVTTATEHWTDEQRQPGAGIIYRLQTEATGLQLHGLVATPPGRRSESGKDAVRD